AHPPHLLRRRERAGGRHRGPRLRGQGQRQPLPPPHRQGARTHDDRRRCVAATHSRRAPRGHARGEDDLTMAQPKTASVVIIGGGVVGCSIAYHLARRGQRDVVVLERETVGSGTTSKAAGGIRAQFPTETEIRFSLESLKVLQNFTEEFGVDPGFKQIGYLFLLSPLPHVRGGRPAGPGGRAAGGGGAPAPTGASPRPRPPRPSCPPSGSTISSPRWGDRRTGWPAPPR